MPKLHELLAVENDVEKVSRKLVAESIKTLGKDNLFNGQVRTLTHFNSEDALSDTQEPTELTTTVDENINYVVDSLAEYFDVVYQKDLTNQQAVADIVIDEQVIAADVPSTFLLGMEKKLNSLRDLYTAIPTLQPGIKWQVAENEGAGIFQAANDIEQFKTKKDIDFKEVAPATKEHKAQIVQYEVVVNVGKYVTTKTSGMFTPLEKANRISRLDKILKAVKQARNRANATEVVRGKIGKSILDYING